MNFLAALGFFIFAAVSCAPAAKDQSGNVYFLIPDQKATFIKAELAGASFPAISPAASLGPSFYPNSFLQRPTLLRVQIAEPVAADARLSKVPLLLVPESFLQVRKPADHHIQPFIAEVPSSEAVPNLSAQFVASKLPLFAVPVQLKTPIKITSPQALVSFPSAFSVHQPGQAGTVPMHVEAVLVPTPEKIKDVSPSSPVIVNLVLAVTAPGQAVSIQIDIKPEESMKPAEGEPCPVVGAGAPTTEETSSTTTATPTTTTTASTTSTTSTTTEVYTSTSGAGSIEIEVNSNGENAAPEEEELENREPPPIVESPQVVFLGLFNSKDTPHLLQAIQQAILRL